MNELEASINESTEELRARLVEQGYLYLPGFLGEHVSHEFRARLNEVISGNAEFQGAMSGTTHHRTLGKDAFRSIYPDVQAQESLHRLAYDPVLVGLAESLLGGEVFSQPAKAVRIAPPGESGGYTTKPHQDFSVQHVTTDTVTVWIPLTPCTPEKQGLRLIPGSHRHGFLPTDPSLGGARPLYLAIAEQDDRWASANFGLGDVVVFHSLTVHSGGQNTGNSLRISVDLRYQRVNDRLRPEFARPHGWPHTPDWDVLTEGWNSRRWVRVPESARIVPMPASVKYSDYLTALVPPPSLLLGQR